VVTEIARGFQSGGFGSDVLSGAYGFWRSNVADLASLPFASDL